MDDIQEKLPILLKHWIEHNREHEVKLREWAQKAEGLRGKEVSQAMHEAVALMKGANQALAKALQALEGDKS